MVISELERPTREITINSVINPTQLLKEQAARSARTIETCWWFHPINMGLDFPLQGLESLSPQTRHFISGLTQSLESQDHSVSFPPTNNSDMILGFYSLPAGSKPLTDRVLEVKPPMLVSARDRHHVEGITNRNYTAVVTLDDDIRSMGKREMERTVRMLMLRLGALKILLINPQYYALATMEGGLGVELTDQPLALDRLRDRLVTHACAKEAGSFKPVIDAISEEAWQTSSTPDQLVSAFSQLYRWGYIDKPFEFTSVVSMERARLASFILGYSRQSESAAAVVDPTIIVSDLYRMGNITGSIIATASGRFNVDKTNLRRNIDLTVVSVKPGESYQPGPNDPLSLYGFDRYALGRKGQAVKGPSIEFDEMSAAIFSSPIVRVSLHPNGKGYRLDPKGEIYLPRVRAFLHIHQSVKAANLHSLLGRIEYVPANLDQFPFPVGCGKDIMFACSTDATRRSLGVNNLESGVIVVFFDAINHGTNFLVLTEPLPETDLIPYDPFRGVLLPLLNPETGSISLTGEIAQI